MRHAFVTFERRPFPRILTEGPLATAAKSGSVEILAQICETTTQPYSALWFALNAAIAGNHVDAVSWLCIKMKTQTERPFESEHWSSVYESDVPAMALATAIEHAPPPPDHAAVLATVLQAFPLVCEKTFPVSQIERLFFLACSKGNPHVLCHLRDNGIGTRLYGDDIHRALYLIDGGECTDPETDGSVSQRPLSRKIAREICKSAPKF